MGCHSFLQGIFPTQGSNSDLLHCRQVFVFLFLPSEPQGSPQLKKLSLKETDGVLCPSPEGAGVTLCVEARPCPSEACLPGPWGPVPPSPPGHASWPLTCGPVLRFCLDLPVQILKPATFTDTAHYPLLLVV